MAEKVGIKNIGIYLPRFRLSGKVLSEAWRKPMGKGIKTVPNFDEDSLTLAVGAVVDTVTDESPEALYFATTTAPYDEKSSASLIASAANLPNTIRTVDFGGSLRASSSALIAAVESIRGGSLNDVVVAASDIRFAEPGSDLEPFIGAGAAALELTSFEKDNTLELIDIISTGSDLTDYWRRTEDRYIHHSDLKYAATYGATKTTIETISRFLEESGKNIAEYHKVIISVPDGRSPRGIAKKLGLKPEQFQDSYINQIGLIGTAHAFVMLADAAVNSPLDSDILLANYGDGCDVIHFRKSGELKTESLTGGVVNYIKEGIELSSYTKYLSYHNLISESTQNLSSEPFSSTILTYREEPINIRLQGKRCNKCGTILTLELNVCQHCNAKEDFEYVNLNRNGKINTYTQEWYYPTPEPPVTMAVVDLDGGGRVTVQMTDTDPNAVEIDMPVELTFRRLHSGAEFWNYCWKARPITKPDAGGG